MSIYLIAMKADNHTYLESPLQPFLGFHGKALRDIPKRRLRRRLGILRYRNELVAYYA